MPNTPLNHLADKHPLFRRLRNDWPPVTHYISRELLAVEDDGQVRMRFQARPEWANGREDVQGGFVAVMLDALLGGTAVSQLPSTYSVATIEMKVSYFRPTPVATLYGIGRIIHQGSSTVFTEGELLDEHGAALAAATSTLRIIQLR